MKLNEIQTIYKSDKTMNTNANLLMNLGHKRKLNSLLKET